MNKYCPNCRDQFRPEVETCPDCGVSLVAGEPPTDALLSDERSIELVRTRDRLMLNRLVGLLDEAGVEYQLGEGIVLSSIVGDIAQPVRVRILESDEAKGREILTALEGAELAEGELIDTAPETGDSEPEGGAGPIKPN